MDENHKPILMEMFPNTSERQIDEIMQMVQESGEEDEPEYQLEAMINLLTESGDSSLNIDHDGDEGAVGFVEHGYSRLSDNLLQLYPDIDVSYLKSLVSSRNATLDSILDELSSGDYPKKEVDYLDVWEQLKSMLPGADPNYLKNQARRLCNKPEEAQKFVQQAIENNDYPTLQDYLKLQKEKQETNTYKTFDIEKFLEVIPNPDDYFSDENRTISLKADIAKQEDIDYAMFFLYNHYRFLRIKYMDKVFDFYNRDLVKTCSRLDRLPKAFRTPRKLLDTGDTLNVALLQEIAYVKHKKQIRRVLKMKDEIYRDTKENARAEGCLQTCTCCYDEELLPEECYFCEKNCIFCKDCIKRGTEIAYSMGEIYFPCLNRCGSEFGLPTLKMVLSKKTFDSLAHKIQLEEIKNAQIDGLENCPHCDFVMIPDEGDKIFKCQNVECMKETCRECRHPAHIPLRCNEIEYDEDVKLRTYIENEMTKALLRQCYQCKKEFIKSSGCNKMTCTCGAKMCYVCGAVVKDYNHFGDNRCPLFTDNLNQLHMNRILQGAERAKMELGIDNQNVILKFDPARNIAEHFANLPDIQ